MLFKELIKQARLKVGLSQEKAGAAINRTRNAIKGYEEGISSPNPDQLVTLCKLYKTNPNDLLGFQQQNEEAKMRETKYKFWSGNKMFTELNEVMMCLRQQVAGIYDHIGLHGAAFPQYTGLKDKNGKEIYEGDIVSSVNMQVGKYNSKVEFQSGSFMFFPINASGVGWDRLSCIQLSCEVIGNIYEHGDLLND